MRVCAIGDVMLDVVVRAERELREDDDTPARVSLCPGGQAANVGSWVTHLGGQAVVVGPRTSDSTGVLLQTELEAQGVELVGPVLDTTSAAVVSIVVDGRRTLASDPGQANWLDHLTSAQDWTQPWDWVFVSGYPLLRGSHTERLVELCRTFGRRVVVDLASAVLIESAGYAACAGLLRALRPQVVLGTAAEWRALEMDPGQVGCDAVLKRGAKGATFWQDGHRQDLPAAATRVVDSTGAGDALAAGLMVGGRRLAMRAAAECVGTVGAQPRRRGTQGSSWQDPAEGRRG